VGHFQILLIEGPVNQRSG